MFHKYSTFTFSIKEKQNNGLWEEYRNKKVLCKEEGVDIHLYSNTNHGHYTLYLQNRYFYFTVHNQNKTLQGFDADIFKANIKYKTLEMPKKRKKQWLVLTP